MTPPPYIHMANAWGAIMPCHVLYLRFPPLFEKKIGADRLPNGDTAPAEKKGPIARLISGISFLVLDGACSIIKWGASLLYCDRSSTH
jgi:hypothetical protein